MWRDYKTDPPFDYRTDVHGMLEVDPDRGFICYWYPLRAVGRDKGPFVSGYACEFKDGAFVSFEAQTDVSPTNHPLNYPDYAMEVLAWMPVDTVKSHLLALALSEGFGGAK